MRDQRAEALQPRLLTVAGMLEKDGALLDVGSNHGRLCAYLAATGWEGKLIASDISAPSLDRARQRFQRLGLEGRVELRNGDGLQVVAPGEVSACVIAGMGGRTIAKILEAAPRGVAEKLTLVLQPQSHLSQLRHYLWTHGWRIQCERLSRDAGRFYVVLRAVPGQEEPYTPVEEALGRRLLADGDPLLQTYLSWNSQVLCAKRKGMANSRHNKREELERIDALIARCREG